MNFLSRILLTISVSALCITGRADDAHPVAYDGSSPAYQFLNITNSSRIYGLGGVNISTVTPDVSVVGQNPALLGPEYGRQLSVNYMHYVGGSNFAGLTFGTPSGEHGAWGMELRYFGYGSMPETDINGAVLGSFAPKDIVVSGLYSHDITSSLRGGASIKLAYSSYNDYSAVALGVDLGINYFDAERDLSLSAAIVNLGGQVKRFDQSYDRIPTDVRLGWTKSFGTLPIRFSVTAWNLTRWHLPYYKNSTDNAGVETTELAESFGANLFRHLVFGADFVPNERFNLSIGYNYKSRTDMSTYSRSILSGFSIGAGLSMPDFGVGIALAQPHTGATTLMLNLTLNMDNLLNN